MTWPLSNRIALLVDPTRVEVAGSDLTGVAEEVKTTDYASDRSLDTITWATNLGFVLDFRGIFKPIYHVKPTVCALRTPGNELLPPPSRPPSIYGRPLPELIALATWEVFGRFSERTLA